MGGGAGGADQPQRGRGEHELVAAHFLAGGGEEPAKYGLDKPTTEARLFRADGTEIGAVLFGKQDADRLYLKTRSVPTIYAADPKQVTLPKSVDELKG